ncbi:MAG: NAD(P)H-hydrate dehydratase [Pseudobutyrivibrio sp.]|nr:NAD(P)H-hydrate dehydratase [Pseudobutyrivibrio sp.]
MKKILTSKEMKMADESTIKKHGIPSMVLMERAALACVDEIGTVFNDGPFVMLCGVGNNGADGVAIARLCRLKNQDVSVYICGDESRYTAELKQQIEIAKSYDVLFCKSLKELPDNPAVIVDALFGIGLSREVTGEYAKAIQWINQSKSYVVSVDMPSGYCADTGRELGVGVHADVTVTFSYKKRGQLLGKCKAEGCGRLVVADAGIYCEDDVTCFEAMPEDVQIALPPRKKDANKGSCGKLLVIAGSQDIYGACYLCAHAAMVTGAGLVKVYTHVNNTDVLKDKLPEAITVGYKEFDRIQLKEMLDWADVVLIGPGISCCDISWAMVDFVMNNYTGPVIADADALTILAENKSLIANKNCSLIITPHMKEMSRLCGLTIADINEDMVKAATYYAREYDCIIILKNHCTVIGTPSGKCYINTTGNEGMATAGSGDVLSGIVASLLAQKMETEASAYVGAMLHGTAGDIAALNNGKRGMMASDIVTGIKQFLKDY